MCGPILLSRVQRGLYKVSVNSVDLPHSSGEGFFVGTGRVRETIQLLEFPCLQQAMHSLAVVGHGVDIGTGVAIQTSGLRISNCARQGLRLRYLSTGYPASRDQQ